MRRSKDQKIQKLRAAVKKLAAPRGDMLHTYKPRKNWNPFEESSDYCTTCGEGFAVVTEVCKPALKKLLQETV